MKKTVLISGGAGFLGSHLCDLFLERGFRVICLDNFLTGSKENISHLREGSDFGFIEHDISNSIQIEERLDYILHFASPASPIDYLRLPIQTMKVGALGTHNIMGLARKHKATVLLASTSEVYGDPLVHPQSENYWGNVNPVGPRGVYDEAKRYAEALVLAYHRFHKIDTKIVRIFNTYGPRMRIRDGRAIPAFMTQAILEEPITVYGDGSQTRSFCYVSDLIEGIYRLLLSDHNLPVNIGNPNEMTLLELAKEIKKITASKSPIVFEPLPEDDPKIRQPDISKARQLLNWEPKTDFYQGMEKTYQYFREKLTQK